MTSHTVPSDLLNDKDYCTVVEANFRINGRSHSLGFSPEGQPGRQVCQGPLITDLFGWMNERATVIALHPIHNPEPVYQAEIGDTVTIDTVGTFVISQDRWKYVRLEVAETA